MTSKDHYFFFPSPLLVRVSYWFLYSTNFKLALKSALYDLVGARDTYREATQGAGVGMHRDVILRYIELQALIIAPIAPHWAEYIWLEVLKKVNWIWILLFKKYQ